MSTLSNVSHRAGGTLPVSTDPLSRALPKAISTSGVSVSYVPSPDKQWYVFRASYGREVKAADHLIEDGTYAYVARRIVRRQAGGKSRLGHASLLPNLLFAYTTSAQADDYVYRTPSLSYLTYYYNHFVHTIDQKNPPLTVPCGEMENFVRATCSMNEHLMVVASGQCHYKSGDQVVVTDGVFKGVTGRVARVSGQQRVVLSLSQLGLIATAYIPTAFIQKTEV